MIQRLPNKLPFALMGAHICVDSVQGGLAAVLPFLALQCDYSYFQITMLVLACNAASAVIQPLFGWLGDKQPRPWLMALGVSMAGIGIALIGLFPAFSISVVAAGVAGIGNAMLHPEGARLANLTGGNDKAVSMSVFSLGGQVGFCVGPIISVAAINMFGLAGTVVYLALCLPYAAFLLGLNRRFRAYDNAGAAAAAGASAEQDRWGVFGILLGAQSVRSVIFYGVTSFFPLFMISTFATPENTASLLITAFAVVGAIATASSGFVAHRIATPKLMVVGYIVIIGALVIFASGVNQWICVAALMVLALALNVFNPPAIALSQSYVPQHLGMASGLSFGVAVSFGGLVSPALGAMGDTVGLVPVLYLVAVVALAGLACSAAVWAIAARDAKAAKCAKAPAIEATVAQ